jgi:hypothetical protein
VVTAARKSLQDSRPDLVLPYVQAEKEPELRQAFELAVKARAAGPEAREVADRWFFETAVRLHRTGEGAPFTGLKPAGLDVGPVIPAAERALESGTAEQVTNVLCAAICWEAQHRLEHAMKLKEHVGDGVPAAREYVEAMLGFQVWAHGIYRQATAIAAHGSG